MADTTVADFLNLTPAVITTSGTITKSLNFVTLSTVDIALTLPTASAGRLVKIVVAHHPTHALTSGVVRVSANTGDTIQGGTGPIVTWELYSSVTFVAIDATDWQVVDVL